MKSLVRLLALSPFAALALAASATVARADCGAARDYSVHVDGNTVTVCPSDPTVGGCPQPGGMLRLDTATGDVVQLAEECSDDAGAGSCYVDECVAPGTYEYGYATPFACCTDCCGTDYFVHAVVAQAVSGCVSEAGAPTSVSGAPWDAGDPAICVVDNGNDGGAVSTSDGGGAVTFRPDSGTDTTAPSGGGGGGGGGCAVVAPIGTEHAILVIDGVALLAGLAFFARRRSGSKK
jgi:hypothetical protein